MEILSHVGCFLLGTRVNIYVTKQRLLLVLSLTKQTIKKNKETKVQKNIKKSLA